MKSFQARLDILPPAQRSLWPRFAAVRSDFVLYGGTALALRLGHRQSVDFDFFTHRELEPEAILAALPFLEAATVLQSGKNTYTVQVLEADDFVRISFFGTISFGRIRDPEWTQDIASLIKAGYSLACGHWNTLKIHYWRTLAVLRERS